MAFSTPPQLLNLLTHTANAFVTLVIFYILKFIFELNFQCSCSQGINFYDFVYLAVPPFIIFFLGYVVDKNLRRCHLNVKLCKCGCLFVKQQILRLALAVAFWISAVFLDGDWYTCYLANRRKMGMGHSCEDQGNITYEDTSPFQNEAKKESMGIGLILTVSFVGVWALSTCCEVRCNCSEPYYKRLYKYHLSQETEAFLTEELKQIAQEKAQLLSKKALEEIRKQERHETTVKDDPWHTISDICPYQSLHNIQEMAVYPDIPQPYVSSPAGPSISSPTASTASSTTGPTALRPGGPSTSNPTGPSGSSTSNPTGPSGPSTSNPTGPSGPSMSNPTGPSASKQTFQSTQNPTGPSASKPTFQSTPNLTGPRASSPAGQSKSKSALPDTSKSDRSRPCPPEIPPKPPSSAIPPNTTNRKNLITKSASAGPITGAAWVNPDAEGPDTEEPLISNRSLKHLKTTKTAF